MVQNIHLKKLNLSQAEAFYLLKMETIFFKKRIFTFIIIEKIFFFFLSLEIYSIAIRLMGSYLGR